MKRNAIGFLTAIASLLLVSSVWACGGAGCKTGAQKASAPVGDATTIALASDKATSTVTVTKAAYPVDYCIVSGEKLGKMGDPVVRTYNGREVQFCCEQCVASFEKDQAKYMKKLDAAVATAQKADYPLTTCVVSGEKLGGMGDPVDYVYQNQLVRFCCSGCIGTFEKDPAKFLAKIDAARAGNTTPAPEGQTN